MNTILTHLMLKGLNPKLTSQEPLDG